MWRPDQKKLELIVILGPVVLITLGELALIFEGLLAGTAIHMMALFCFIVAATMTYAWNQDLSRLLVALTLIPLVRLFSTSTPYWPFADTLVWLGVIALPMLAAAFATISVQKLRREDYGFVFGSLKLVPVHIGVVLAGIPLGFVEYSILTPDPWITEVTLGAVALGILVIFFGTGLSEELIFRGILFHDSRFIMSWPAAMLYVTIIFTAMHIGFFSVADLMFVFLVGLFFAFVVYKTKSLVGVVGCHTLLNIVLFLVAPFLF